MASSASAYTEVPRPQNDKYLFATMSTVYSFSISGFTKDDLKVTAPDKNGKFPNTPPTKRDRIEQMVEKKVMEIVSSCKASRSKWSDPDFGPNESDPLGKLSLYGLEPPAPAGTNKYPSPESMRWDRPQYAEAMQINAADAADNEEAQDDDEEFDEFADDFGAETSEGNSWCTEGQLFIDGCTSGDVIQGKLGDCWFLGALAVMGQKVEECFWKKDYFKEFGFFVCVFYKDCSLVYVVIDDRIPVFASNGKVVFGRCKDPNELWVPLIEKAYAKLHGCYKALIGGYVHFALADMTGYSPRLVGLKEGYMGYSDALSSTEIWDMLVRYCSWGCFMGCSIQSAVKEAHKVETDVGDGLKMGHAYSLLGVGTITTTTGDTVQLVKCRNPWGFGEWTGAWGDDTNIRKVNSAAIDAAFPKEIVEARSNDGTFFMEFSDWKSRFTSLFVAVNFPGDWSGSMVIGNWTGDKGGPRGMSTWVGNPKLKLKLQPDPTAPDNKCRQVFVGLYINDPRLVLGKEYYTDPLYKTALGFDIVTEEDVEERMLKNPPQTLNVNVITGSKRVGEEAVESTKQPPYMYGSTQVETMLTVGKEYYVVPSLRQRKQSGVYYLHVYSSAPFSIEGGVSTSTERKSKPICVGARETKMTMVQFAERKEEFREKLLAEVKRLKLGEKDMRSMFGSDSILRSALKRKMMDVGLNLADFPDEDFALLDEDNSGAITAEEFLTFVGDGLKLTDPSGLPPIPTETPDDLLFQPVDLTGTLSVKVCMAKSVRMPKTWFEVLDEKASSQRTSDAGTEKGSDTSSLSKCSIIRYDHKLAAVSMAKPIVQPVLHPRLVSDISLVPSQKVNRAVVAEDQIPALPKVSDSPSRIRSGGKKSSPLGYIDEDAVSEYSVVQGPLRTSTLGNSVDKVALAAGHKLHKDPKLQKVESMRCSFLSKLRAQNASLAQTGDADASNNSILLKKIKRTRPVYICDSNSAGVRQFLGIPESSELALGAAKRPSMASGSFSSGRPPALDLSLSMESLRGEHLAPDTPHPIIQKGVLKDALDSTEDYFTDSVDIWDLLIDRVDVICNCRSKKARELTFVLNNSFRIQQSINLIDLNKFERPPSRVPTPAKSAECGALCRKTGTAVVSRSRRSVVRTNKPLGNAAVTLTAQQRAKVIQTAQDIERALTDDSGSSAYVEVYRRIINIPIDKFEPFQAMADKGTSNATDGFVSGEGLRHWFDFFDKNNDGEITLSEFSQTLKELNLKFDDEDVRSLFKLIDSAKKDNLADFDEFMNFFSGYIPYNSNGVVGKDAENQFAVINFMRKLSERINRECKDVPSCNAFFESNHVPESIRSGSQLLNENHTTSDDLNHSIAYGLQSSFTTLSRMEESSNASKFRKMGLKHASDDTIARFSRVFRQSSVSMSKFFRIRHTSVKDVVDKLIDCILESFTRRAGGGKEITFASKEIIVKLWSSVAVNAEGKVGFDELSDALKKAVADLLHVENSENAWKKQRHPSGDALNPAGSGQDESLQQADVPVLTFRKNVFDINDAEFMTYDLDVLCRMVADKLSYSSWNKLGEDRLKTAHKKTSKEAVHLIESLSFSGFECFIKGKRLSMIERSLKYLVHLQSTEGAGRISYHVHVYLPKKPNDKNNGAILLAYDPLTSAIFKMNIDADTSLLPRGADLENAVLSRYPNLSLKAFLESRPEDAHAARCATRLYNHVETPLEDKAISDLCDRLRLVDTGPKVKLFLSEEPKLIEEIKLMLQSADLPFFSVANALSLTFEISREFMQKVGTVRKAIFGNVRKNRRLTNFFLSINPNILVVLGVYDSDQTEIMEWKEMLAHLSEYRNPFVTVQLLPKYKEPVGIEFSQAGGKVEENEPAFLFDSSEDDITGRVGYSDDPENPVIQKSLSDIDGGAFPEWNSNFVMKFTPPKLTSCRVLFNDVMKIKIDGSITYVIVMVREAPDKSIFLTAYDSRRATEYELIGGPKNWRYAGINDKAQKELFERCYPNANGEHRITVFSDELEDCIAKSERLEWTPATAVQDQEVLTLGEVITPRLLVSVYNQKGKGCEELLGSCQVSLSAVLSGTGTDKIQWTQLIHEYINDDGKTGTSPAGSIMLKLGYERGTKATDDDGVRDEAYDNKAEKVSSVQPRLAASEVKPVQAPTRPKKDEPVLAKHMTVHSPEVDDRLPVAIEMKVDAPDIPASVPAAVPDVTIPGVISAPITPVRPADKVADMKRSEEISESSGFDQLDDCILERKQAIPAPIPRPPDDFDPSDLSSASMRRLNISVPASSEAQDSFTQPNTFSHIHSKEGSASPELSRTENMDYDTMRLPPHWDRRLDPKTGKMYYVNHERKTTQWYHPNDPRGRRQRTKQGGSRKNR